MLAAAAAVVIGYVIAMTVIHVLLSTDTDAAAELYSLMPHGVYRCTEVVFFVTALIDAMACLFEESYTKRENVVLIFAVKAISWHCEHLIATGSAVVLRNTWGGLVLPARYVQWMLSTPTLLFLTHRLACIDAADFWGLLANDELMLISGLAAGYACSWYVSAALLATSLYAFYFVMWMQCANMRRLRDSCCSQFSKACWTVAESVTLLTWHAFPVAWILSHVHRRFRTVRAVAEGCTVAANLLAKFMYSSCVLQNNFITAWERKEVHRLAREAKERTELLTQLNGALRTKEEFLRRIGNNLYSPLLEIMSASATIQRTCDRTMCTDCSNVITLCARNLSGVLNDILLVKSAAAGIELDLTLVPLGPVLSDAVLALLPLAQPRVAVESCISIGVPAIVGDQQRIQQIVRNLVHNALKFTSAGQVDVRAKADRLGRSVTITVEDSGCGMSPDALKHALTPFSQDDKGSGIGIGLTIVKVLVKAHHGSLFIGSRQGLGTTVNVVLPVLQPENPPEIEAQFAEQYARAGHDYADLVGRRTVTGYVNSGVFVSFKNSKENYLDATRAMDGSDT